MRGVRQSPRGVRQSPEVGVPMLTKADDFPVHQRPEPVAFSGTDRNFYDRYFFNGQNADGTCFVAAALGVYPHLNIIDAAFCFTKGGEQRSVFASRILHQERMDTFVGPLSVEVLEPLQRIRVKLAETDGLSADMIFNGFHRPIEEPRFTRRIGPRTLMDVTRMTQSGGWSGQLLVDGVAMDAAELGGTRDRSWGIRPIGAADAQPLAPAFPPQFFWLWAPLRFERHCLYFHTNDDAEGNPWNRSAVLVDLETAIETRLLSPRVELDFKPGSRAAASARVSALHPEGGEIFVELQPESSFYMHGIGYGHPRHAHGSFQGELNVATERFDALGADVGIPANGHIQALTAAKMTLPDGHVALGRGILEQLIIGPHAPSGFRQIYDLA